MQTVGEFAKEHNVKKTETVVGWCDKGYIPGAVKEVNTFGEKYWMIPDHAMVPYYELRYHKGTSPYYSMVKACIKQRHIVPALYKMDEARFKSYINNLIEAGFITDYLDDDGITHYTETPKGEKAVEAGRTKFMKMFEKAMTVAEAAATAFQAVAALV